MPVLFWRVLPYLMIGAAVLGAVLWWNSHWAKFYDLEASVATLTTANQTADAAIKALQENQAKLDEALQAYQIQTQDALRVAAKVRSDLAGIYRQKPVADYVGVSIPDPLRERLCGQFRCGAPASGDVAPAGRAAAAPTAP